ncbi:serine/threonine-protein kinase [Saccharothrix variisporea]|uniref:non-specific serine/threonine protein kinase n=1 Tax=Saccharothrix variisporea TaxID=543527 RepID=A0A495XKT8_9PSEU|nr:serine/threonine-protein kinase [Saccharothrix variisporea]RKT72208.1 serine/threonine protein kinase [Saccharothrix variisporea]
MHKSGSTVGGRYALAERVGSGAMGVVWRAHDALLDREVAVKQLRWPDLSPDEARVAGARALREARNAARLHHPNAVAVFDVVVEDDRPWLVMEYVPARSLAELLADHGPLDHAETARIGGHVASALAAAHAAGIVHRDVKPSNVLIGHDGVVKLTDFGISRAANDGTLTDSGMITGTPAYLAPEVARGDQPGTAADVFSLGATLYAASEGRPPYGSSDNSLGLLYKAANGDITPPTPGKLSGVLTRLLAVDPAERPSASDTVDLLANPPADRPRPGWMAPAIAATILVLAAGAIAAASLTSPTATSPPAQTDAQLAAPAFSESDVEDFVRDHYALVTNDPLAAWENLSPDFRPIMTEYTRFWSQYDTVRVGDVFVNKDGEHFTAEVQLTFVQDGAETAETYQLRLHTIDGHLEIVASERIA